MKIIKEKKPYLTKREEYIAKQVKKEIKYIFKNKICCSCSLVFIPEKEDLYYSEYPETNSEFSNFITTRCKCGELHIALRPQRVWFPNEFSFSEQIQFEIYKRVAIDIGIINKE